MTKGLSLHVVINFPEVPASGVTKRSITLVQEVSLRV